MNEQFSNKTILVVDDDKMNRRVAEMLLTKNLGVSVLLAQDGMECISQLQENPAIDLVLLDIQMPHVDGFQTLKLIRNHSEWKDIPVVFLTASTDEETMKAAEEKGVDGYLKKPFLPAELTECVKKIFNS